MGYILKINNFDLTGLVEDKNILGIRWLQNTSLGLFYFYRSDIMR